MPSKPLPYRVILASASPRRRELLHHLVSGFTVQMPRIDEDALTTDDPWQTAQRLAREKALAVFEENPEALVIGGDTVVAYSEGEEYRQLSKPGSPAEAMDMLRALSNRTHIVITGIAIRWPSGLTAFTDASRVTFRELSETEIKAYVASGEPMDKAGGYAIQGGAGQFVSQLEGSLNNVIGLPTERLEEALRDIR